MKRRLFNILSAVSLLLCVVTIGLWTLNIWLTAEWGYCGEDRTPYFAVLSTHGCITIDAEYQTSPPRERLTGIHAFPAYNSYFRWNHLGFVVQIVTGFSVFVIPDWFICSITAIVPWLWYRSYRQHRLSKLKGLCLICGYDLRASKDRCPECGTPIIATESKA